MRLMQTFISVAGLVLLPGLATAQQVGSPTAGLGLAEQWCSECHIVSGEVETPTPGAPPSFHAVAADPAVTEIWLRTFFVTPHPVMPNIILSQEQIDDLVVYFLSLKAE